MEITTRRLINGAAILAALWIITHSAHAATGLAITCPLPGEAGKPVATSCGGQGQEGQIYKTPAGTDLVRVDPARKVGDAAVWDASNVAYQWKAWSALAAGELFEVCTTDIPDPTPLGTGCAAWNWSPRATMAPTLTVAPTTGRAPLSVAVTWAVQGGTNCQAGGAWSGAKAAQGTESVTLPAGAAAFSLTCSVPGTPTAGPVRLSWVAPTQNTDGSAYTNAAGYVVTYGKDNPPVTEAPRITSPATLTTTIQLAPGAWFFGLQAISTSGALSEKAIVAGNAAGTPTTTTWAATATATVTAPPAPAKPKAPTGLTITVQ